MMYVAEMRMRAAAHADVVVSVALNSHHVKSTLIYVGSFVAVDIRMVVADIVIMW